MEITPIASDSQGVRSMAVLVEAGDLGILIDPGARLGPSRYGLPPHEKELTALSAAWKRLLKEARKADVMTISHYHYDHHEPENAKMFRGKRLFVKHPAKDINSSQRERAKAFLTGIGDLPGSIEYADGRTFELGGAMLEFSEAVPHGTNARLGYVVQLAVSDGGTTFLHSSDVEGPSLDCQLEFVLEKEPDVYACDGPMTYMMYRYGTKALARSLDNLVRIIAETRVKTMMLDHHLLRDLKWRERVQSVFQAGEEHGCRVTTFAGYLGEEEVMLEARRRELWKGE